ncbi:hypothetical protein ACEPPN_016554 [Leptodophora sp. 'Broadleaf-Isolate-01']
MALYCDYTVGPGVFNLCDNLKQVIFVADEERFMAGMFSGEKDFTDYDYTPKDKNLRLLPRKRMDLWEEKDHPFLSLYKADIENLQRVLKEDAVVETFKGIKISFELWRRPTRSPLEVYRCDTDVYALALLPFPRHDSWAFMDRLGLEVLVDSAQYLAGSIHAPDHEAGE